MSSYLLSLSATYQAMRCKSPRCGKWFFCTALNRRGPQRRMYCDQTCNKMAIRIRQGKSSAVGRQRRSYYRLREKD